MCRKDSITFLVTDKLRLIMYCTAQGVAILMVRPPDDIERFRQDGLKSLAKHTTLGEKHREATTYGETIFESHGHIKLLLDYSSLNVVSFTFRSQRILERFGRIKK